MTKQNIEAISGGDVGFDMIYRSGINLYVDFTHQKKTGNYTAQPTPRLLTFFIFLTKNTPAVSPINEYIKVGLIQAPVVVHQQ